MNGLADGLTTVRNSDVGNLGPDAAVDLLRELLWCEVGRLRLSRHHVDVSAVLNADDGGVDATVDAQAGASAQPSGLIFPGKTCYQVKSGAFSASPSKIKKLLLNDDKLKPRVESCLAGGGVYVPFFTAWDTPDKTEDTAADEILKEIQKHLPHVKPEQLVLLRQNQIRGLISQYPSLASRVKQVQLRGFLTYEAWGLQDEMRKELQFGDTQKELVKRLREAFSISTEALHISLCGEAGIGKTRLAFESLKLDDLAPLTLYTDDASGVMQSEFLGQLLHADNSWVVTLVIDECNAAAAGAIWDQLRHLGARVRLVTISKDPQVLTGDTRYHEVPKLDVERVADIVASYGVPRDQAARVARLCGGSPRFAHQVGLNLLENPDNPLRPTDTRPDVYDRLISGPVAAGDPRVQQRKVILQHAALFTRFGYGGSVQAESRVVHALAEKVDPAITWPVFQDLVSALREEKLLQGESTLYVTPTIFQLWLWSEWWRIYGDSFDPGSFLSDLTPDLRKWFAETFRYAHGSNAVNGVIAKLLGANGLLRNSEVMKSEFGSLFFSYLSSAAPGAAVRALKATVGTWTVQERREATSARRNLVNALETIVLWPDYFADAANLLLDLAEAENESWANNASGVFAGLFSLGYGAVAPTAASPEQRLPVLESALTSAQAEKRKLALAAINEALETGPAVRLTSAEYEGFSSGPKRWMPETYAELYKAYGDVWQLASNALSELPSGEGRELANVLTRHAPGLASLPGVGARVLSTMEATSSTYPDLLEPILEAVLYILRSTADLEEASVARWEALSDRLSTGPLEVRIRRYVCASVYDPSDPDSHLGKKKSAAKVKEIAAEVSKQPELLSPLLGLLISGEAKNAYAFGYALAEADPQSAILPLLVESYRSQEGVRDCALLGGYLRVRSRKNPDDVEGLIREWSRDTRLVPLISELVFRAGATEQTARFLLNLAASGQVPVTGLTLFSYGSALSEISDDLLHDWTRVLAESADTRLVSSALGLLDQRYGKRSARTPPREQTLELLLNDALFKSDSARNEQMTAHHWESLALAFARSFPTAVRPLVEKTIEHFGDRKSLVERRGSGPRAFLEALIEKKPEIVWKVATTYLKRPLDVRALALTHWLRGDHLFARHRKAPIEDVPRDLIWSWIDADPESRATHAASFAPGRLVEEDGSKSLAHALLVRYGDRAEVGNELVANFSSEGFSGPSSEHYRQKAAQLRSLRESETDRTVITWIEDYVEQLESGAEHALIREERED